MKGVRNTLAVGALTFGALAAGYHAGRTGTPTPVEALLGREAALSPDRHVPVQNPNDPREVIPLLPGPGQQPGQGPGEQPGPSQGPPQEGEQCTVLLFRDGQLYEFEQPGRGQQPGPGEGQPGDSPGGDDEVFPLRPYDGPSPLPRNPNNPGIPEPRRI